MPATKTQRRRAGKKRGTQSRRSRRGSTRGSAAAGRSSRKRASRRGSTRAGTRKTSTQPQARKRSSGSKPSRQRSRTSSRGRRYGPKTEKMVETEMRHLKKGEHKNRKQAIAIGLSKARRAGAKVPPRPQPRKAA